MRNLTFITVVLFLCQSLLGDEWKSLFNHQNLEGWRANNDPESFSVQNGLLRIQASGTTSAHLFYVGEHSEGTELFTNFELEATVRAEPDSNGGIFFHTDMSVRDSAKHLAQGYEVQLNSSKQERRKTGSLYAIVDRMESPVDEILWFDVRIVVNGKRIIVKVNGEQTADYTEPVDVNRPTDRAGRVLKMQGGAVALQAHDRHSVWYIKDIRIKRLP